MAHACCPVRALAPCNLVSHRVVITLCCGKRELTVTVHKLRNLGPENMHTATLSLHAGNAVTEMSGTRGLGRLKWRGEGSLHV